MAYRYGVQQIMLWNGGNTSVTNCGNVSDRNKAMKYFNILWTITRRRLFGIKQKKKTDLYYYYFVFSSIIDFRVCAHHAKLFEVRNYYKYTFTKVSSENWKHGSFWHVNYLFILRF